MLDTDPLELGEKGRDRAVLIQSGHCATLVCLLFLPRGPTCRSPPHYCIFFPSTILSSKVHARSPVVL